MTHPPRGQRGATLVVALIFLVLMSLFALNAFLGSTTNLRIAGNMQARQEATAAAQVAVERTLAGLAFATSPAAVASAPVAVDIDNNGSTDYTVRMVQAPTCFRSRPVTTFSRTVRLDDPSVLSCGDGSSDPTKRFDANGNPLPEGNPSCTDVDWNIRAEVTDARTGAQVAVNQGLTLRVQAADSWTYCN